MMTDPDTISRAYIARQTAHRTGAAFEVSPLRRGVNPWRVAGLALAVLLWLLLALVAWVGLGR
jgi:hypothetical protein